MAKSRIRDPRDAYRCHKYGARYRGIAFELTFAQWWQIWEPYWPDRELFNLMMCRNGDAGPYAVGNVRIATARANARESYALRGGRRSDWRSKPRSR
jgi:hypothetical protein